jgi:hypothetical protein
MLVLESDTRTTGERANHEHGFDIRILTGAKEVSVPFFYAFVAIVLRGH